MTVTLNFDQADMDYLKDLALAQNLSVEKVLDNPVSEKRMSAQKQAGSNALKAFRALRQEAMESGLLLTDEEIEEEIRQYKNEN